VVLDLDLDTSLLSLLQDGLSDSLTLGEGYEGGGSLSDDKHVGHTCGESVTSGILDVGDLEASVVLLDSSDHTNTTQVTASSDHNHVSDLEVSEVDDLVGGQIELDGVVDLDQGVGVTDGSSVVCGDVWDSVLSNQLLVDTEKLESSLLWGDSVDGESALDVVQKSECLVCGLDGDDILETSGEGGVGSDLTVDLDVSLHKNDLGFTSVEGVLQSVSQQNVEGKTLSQFVGSSGGTRSKNSGELVQHPVAGGVKTL